MYSLMSRRTMLSSEPKYFSARRLVSSVLPTPVGPAKSMDAIGRFGSFRPHRVRLSERDTALTASSWPMTEPERSSSMFARISASSSVMRCTGMPLHIAATDSISSIVTFAPPYAPSPVSSSIFTPSFVRLFLTSRSLSRNRVASSKRSPRTAASFASLTCFSARHISIASMDVALSTSPVCSFWNMYCLMRAAEPASSIRSMALSGRKRSAMYREEIWTAAIIASSVISHMWCASYRSRSPKRISTASSSEGSSTMTGWNLRSRAASFSMYLRCSSTVVAPMHWSSPRASGGLSMLLMSMPPPPPLPTAPAPMRV
mmetsp:Transcript_8087/g.22501  ORF Transcript_8087/g.22501 Transcript_8087/m.22501 type:complete len:316 (-) Transcript_8087:1219-2166(-)